MHSSLLPKSPQGRAGPHAVGAELPSPPCEPLTACRRAQSSHQVPEAILNDASAVLGEHFSSHLCSPPSAPPEDPQVPSVCLIPQPLFWGQVVCGSIPATKQHLQPKGHRKTAIILPHLLFPAPKQKDWKKQWIPLAGIPCFREHLDLATNVKDQKKRSVVAPYSRSFLHRLMHPVSLMFWDH